MWRNEGEQFVSALMGARSLAIRQPAATAQLTPRWRERDATFAFLGFTHYCVRSPRWLVHLEAQDGRETPDVQADGMAPVGLAERRIACCLRRWSQTSRRMGWPEFETLMAHFRLPTPRIRRCPWKSRVRESRMRIREGESRLAGCSTTIQDLLNYCYKRQILLVSTQSPKGAGLAL
jgi:hypothetical protein